MGRAGDVSHFYQVDMMATEEERLSGIDLLVHASEKFQPERIYCGFSGGHDSLVATHLAMSTGLPDAAFTIDTGIGLQATHHFISDVCMRYGWHWLRLSARALGQDYAEIVRGIGFPGPVGHQYVYNLLKERCFNALKRISLESHLDSTDSCIMIVGGSRSTESRRRMNTAKPIGKSGRLVWVNICHDWTSIDRDNYIQEHGLPESPVKKLLCMSGECLCGAYAKKGELAQLKMFFPDDPAVKLIEQLESEVGDLGFDWGWEGRPPKRECERMGKRVMFACHSCNAKHDNDNDLFDAAESEASDE